MRGKTRRILSLVLSFGLLFQQMGFAQVAAELNLANYLSRIGSNIAQEKFRPLHLRYFSYDSLNDNFKVLLDKGDLKNLQTPELENSTKTLLSYFLIGVTLPDDMFWVNLRPDSEDRIIDPWLEKTDVGKIMLEVDLQLKKDTALFTSPQAPEGREYWNRLYKKAAEIFGNENIEIPTLTRPWIVPGEIIVRESKDSAYVYKANLKVMLEQDYLKDSASYNFKDPRSKALNEYSSQLIRELIIPKLTKEVNSSKRYAALRQVYYSLILSRWFKLRFTGKTGTYASLINTRNLTNLVSKETWSKTDYFKQYQKSFADGEYNIKEPVYTPTGQVIRSYFSGGVKMDIQPNGFTHNGKMPVALSNQPGIIKIEGDASTGHLLNEKAEISSSPVGQMFVDGINLSEQWEGLVSKNNGKAFTAESAYDGQEVTWDGIDPGDVLQLGLKLDTTGKIIYWGRNKTKDQELNRMVVSESIKDSEGRDTGFVKVLNEYRALRPNATKTKPIGRQADPKSVHPDNERTCPFGCVDPTKGNSLLNREVSWGDKDQKINGRIWRAQFNAATFEENGHFLWVPDIYDPKQRRSQMVLYEDVLDILGLSHNSNNMIFFYNDPHAGGTVNHIHFQSFYRNDNSPMAIEKSKLSLLAKIKEVAISRLEGYFIEGLVFNNDTNPQLADIIFRFVDLLQNRHIPFNLIFSKDKVYLMPRNPEGEIVKEFPTGVLVSAELCGKIIIVDEKTYNSTDFNKIKAAFSKITVAREDIDNLVEKVSQSMKTSDEESASSAAKAQQDKSSASPIYLSIEWKYESRRVTYDEDKVHKILKSIIQRELKNAERSGKPEYSSEFQTREICRNGLDDLVTCFIRITRGQVTAFSLSMRDGPVADVLVCCKDIGDGVRDARAAALKKIQFFSGGKAVNHLSELGILVYDSDGLPYGADMWGYEGYINLVSSVQAAVVGVGIRIEISEEQYKQNMRLDDFLSLVEQLARAYLNTLARASSSSAISSSPNEMQPGGIDFRTLPMTIQPMGSFNGLDFRLPQLSQAELRQINVASEIKQIKNMVQAGIAPSGERIKELIAACVQKKEMDSQVDNLLLCLADIFKLEEENASESSPELREALVIVDSRS